MSIRAITPQSFKGTIRYEGIDYVTRSSVLRKLQTEDIKQIIPYKTEGYSLILTNKGFGADIVKVDFNTALSAYNASKAYGRYSSNDVVINLNFPYLPETSNVEARYKSLEALIKSSI